MMVCKNYVGVACVNGSCPKALSEEYEKRCMDVPKTCKECWYYRGCEDCAFCGTDVCVEGVGESGSEQ